MKWFLTGATGFLGRHLVRELVRRGDEVVALCRKPDAELERLGVEVREGDVLAPESVLAAAKGCDGAFHAAGKVSREPADAEAMHRVHVDGTRLTLEALAEAGVRRVVYASTSGTVAISTRADDVRDEGAATPTELIARWPYYRTKLYAEMVALAKSRADCEVISINPSLLLGPGDVHGSSTEDVRLFLDRKVPATPGGGIAFVDARDAALAMILAMERGRAGERYLINAANMSLAAFFGRLSRVSGVKAPTLVLPRTSATLAGLGADLLGRAAERLGGKAPLDRLSAEMAQHFWYCDSSKAERELGFVARDPSVTLADTVEDLRARGVVWPG
ncbi:MAG: NAD-dependent epimerase/dehydratase family protein [Deltaproteobacteria bacterium]|nr:NAD-dependent epimerase/dehydratase family protein [Deltaproteobacteria bacterium]